MAPAGQGEEGEKEAKTDARGLLAHQHWEHTATESVTGALECSVAWSVPTIPLGQWDRRSTVGAWVYPRLL